MDKLSLIKKVKIKLGSNSLNFITENSDKLEKFEKKSISKKLNELGMDGNGRFDKPIHALNKINDFLDNMSLELDLDSVDYYRLDNSESGRYLIRLKRKTRESNIEIKNSAIQFSWHLLGNINDPKYNRKYEILAYVS
jgi:hypothetical protein